MRHLRAGMRVMAAERHGFTPLEVDNVDGDTVTVIIDPRIGIRNQRDTMPLESITHIWRSSSQVWEAEAE